MNYNKNKRNFHLVHEQRKSLLNCEFLFNYSLVIGVRPRTVANQDLTVAFENPDLPLSEDEFRTADIYVEFWVLFN